jgi:hypothetical protein
MDWVYYQYKGYMLKCSPQFQHATDKQRAAVCNGMGPKGYGWLVPDTMYGLDVGPAGDIHDYMYAFPNGASQLECDALFLDNMYAIIEQNGGWGWVRWLRRRRAQKYYAAVRAQGAKHYGIKNNE